MGLTGFFMVGFCREEKEGTDGISEQLSVGSYQLRSSAVLDERGHWSGMARVTLAGER